ncbi:hypothetical protein P775_02705 [Puniceibacterium antarcticum]|uniref:Polysaccharide pyruvyl transferase domain-containing protein n=1 Tax=Puniceibacterium antarcticum TaxID=1206336 RepID=A0A2G8RJQ0_9RHOB|nr:polysaccharide pyruvyl transferase family protein [Puniceibacterium antarcticum]PIL21767.1 hypothetical protein P775_02705 [Puniceibacterium antarcticum]
MKICISDIFGSLNRGDALLCDALIHSIKEAAPGAELAGVAHFPEIERERHPDIDWQEAPSRSNAESIYVRRALNGLRSGLTLGYSALGGPSGIAPFYPLPKSQLASIQHIKDADLIVSSAGGFLLDANATIYSHLLQFHLARKFGTPYVLAPQTIGPIRSTRLKKMTAAALSDARIIAVREQYSYDFVVNDLGLPSDKVVRTTDIAFEHEETDPAGGAEALAGLGIAPNERFIGATTVNWKFRGEDNPKAAYEEYREKMVALMVSMHERFGRRIVLFNQVSQDLPLAREVASRCGEAVVLDEADRSTEVMRGMIERADVFLGSRFHSCVFSILGRVPLFCLAYTYKSTGIMDDLNMSDRVAPIGKFNVNNVVETIGWLIENRESESKRINDAVQKMAFPKFSTVLQNVINNI